MEGAHRLRQCTFWRIPTTMITLDAALEAFHPRTRTHGLYLSSDVVPAVPCCGPAAPLHWPSAGRHW